MRRVRPSNFIDRVNKALKEMNLLQIEIRKELLMALVDSGVMTIKDFVILSEYKAEISKEVSVKLKLIAALRKDASSEYRKSMSAIEEIEKEIEQLNGK